MAPTRSASIRLLPTLIHASLCFVVVMQMLGTPASLWQLNVPTDLVEASLLEGLSLIASSLTPQPIVATDSTLEPFRVGPSVLLGENLFRPPSHPRPPMSLA